MKKSLTFDALRAARPDLHHRDNMKKPLTAL